MKKVTLEIADDVFAEIRSATAVKGMCGSLYGVVDSFMLKLIEKIEKGEETITFQFKDKKKK